MKTALVWTLAGALLLGALYLWPLTGRPYTVLGGSLSLGFQDIVDAARERRGLPVGAPAGSPSQP
jgi:hypothetical protein